MNTDQSVKSVDALLSENVLLREEVRVARRAAEITADLVAVQIGKLDKTLHRLEKKNATEQELRQELERRTSELERTNTVLRKEMGERTRLEKEILLISEQEQQRIAHELHDDVGQEFTGLTYIAEALHRRLDAKGHAQAEIAAELAQGISRCLGKLRAIARGLLPMRIGANDLVPAFQSLLANLERRTGVSCRLETGPVAEGLDDDTTIQLYRIAQEAITNSLKHGRAQQVSVRLKVEHGQITLEVEDDGVGLPTTMEASSGVGLRIMRYRTRTIGGELDIRPRDGGGTLVTCSVIGD